MLRMSIYYIRRPTIPSEPTFDSTNQDEKVERDLLRQQTENMVQVSYQSLRDAMSEQAKHAESSETGQVDKAVPEPGGTESAQIQLWREDSERHNTTQWLYNLVFSSYAESTPGNHPAASKITDNDAEAEDPDGLDHTNRIFSMELTTPISNSPEHMRLAAMIQTPVEVPSVVDELLVEWTTLTEDEVAGVVEAGPAHFEPEVPSTIIKFEDCIGRKYDLPYQEYRTWTVSGKIQKPFDVSF